MERKKIILLTCILALLSANIIMGLSLLLNYYLIPSRGALGLPPEQCFEVPASYIITKNATYILAINSNGDVEFSGTEAATVIQYAIDAVGTKGGGKIFIRDGVYNLAAFLDIKQYDYVTIEGESWNTILKTNDGDYNAIYFDGKSTEIGDAVDDPNIGCMIRNLQIDGGASAQGSVWYEKNGIQMRVTQDSTFERLYIHHMGRTGIYNTEWSHRNCILNNFVYHNYRYGVSYTSSSRGRVIGNYIKENKNFGLNWDATMGNNYYTTIDSNIFENNMWIELYVVGTEGQKPMYGVISNNNFYAPEIGSDSKILKMDRPIEVVVDGNFIQGRKQTGTSGNTGIAVNGGEGVVITNNILDTDTIVGISLGGTKHSIVSDNRLIGGGTMILVQDSGLHGECYENSITNNIFTGGSQGVRLQEPAGQGTYNNTFTGNVFSDITVPFSTAYGASLEDQIIKRNIGFVTENSGTASGTSPISVNTGLAIIPPSSFNAYSLTQGYQVTGYEWDPTGNVMLVYHSGAATTITIQWYAET